MAHKYSDFDSAYADLSGRFGTAKTRLEWALTNAQAAFSGASDPVDKTHFGYATYAIEQLVYAVRFLGDFSESAYDQSHLYESIYWAAQGGAVEEYDLTWKKICEAAIFFLYSTACSSVSTGNTIRIWHICFGVSGIVIPFLFYCFLNLFNGGV